MYWQTLIFLVLKCSEIDHPHHFFTESFGANALIYLRMKSNLCRELDSFSGENLEASTNFSIRD